MQSVSLSMLSILYNLCRDFDVPWALDCFIYSHRWLGSWWWRDCIKFGWGQSKCASWSFTDHFFVCIYSSSLANGGLYCLFKFPWLFDCGLESISILSLFFVSIGVFGVDFLFFSFSFDLEVDLCLLFVTCVSFFLVGFVVSCSVGLSLVFIFYEVSFGVFWCLFWCGWLFHQNLCPLGWICWMGSFISVFFVSFGFFLFFA